MGYSSQSHKESNMTEARQHVIYNKSFVILNSSLSPMLIFVPFICWKKQSQFSCRISFWIVLFTKKCHLI